MSCFSQIFAGSPEYTDIKQSSEKGLFPFGVLGLPPASKAFVIHSLCADTDKRALVLTPDEASAVKLCSDLTVLGSRADVFPARDFNFQEASSESAEYEQRRIGALSKVLSGDTDILICSAEGAMQRTIPPDVLKDRIFTLRPGQQIDTDEAKRLLIASGYTFSELVEGPGQFSQRGGILDIFPTNASEPVRIEFFGDEIDTMSVFDTLSQRREDALEEASVSPCSEILFGDFGVFAEKLDELGKSVRGKNTAKVRDALQKDAELLKNGIKPASCDKYFPLAYGGVTTVFDYFSDGFLFLCESGGIKERALSCEKQLGEELRELFLDGVLCKGLDTYALGFSQLTDEYTLRNTVYLDNFARGSFDTPVKSLVNFNVNQLSRWDGTYSILLEDISHAIHNNYTTVIFAGTPKAAEGLLEELVSDEIPCLLCKKLPPSLQKGYVNVLCDTMTGGLEIPGMKFMTVTYGRDAKSTRRSVRQRTKEANAFNSLEELCKGDYVVHATNGIGIFDGIEKVNMEGVTKDYLKIIYAKGDVLFVPVTKLELVSKYIGPHEDDSKRTVKLNRLGSSDWENTKTRVRGAVKDIAEQLIKVYAERQCSPGYAFSPDIDMQNDFERRFEFEETSDQLRCIDEIKEDMEKNCPMDRILCGDVGFGKTEVALRAAFKCICDGKQAAILVPTTILALQHYRTIAHRFDGFPVEAEMLSRFRTPKQQKEIKKRLKEGSIDIIAGTHSLISKDVQFKDLGLLIVDEEQRFGVAQKEKLKEKFPGVDVLTLSATPIPRTLNFAMMGIRDLSMLEEAPMDRYPVQTYVIEHDMGILSQAIAKELRRGGQVYYLHNKIDDIERTALQLKELFPDANIAVGHGKMSEEELSNVWKSLVEGDTDILVCTTIIETGVDVPNANTLIIENADHMGLAQLHQLRGRVGRSSRRASAYFTFTKGKAVSEIAEKRLSTIREFTQFGSGFKIAMRDLEIRGAGNMLGAQQHGHMEAVGYDMYLQLLTEAVAELKSGEKSYTPRRDCLVDIHIDAHIPDKYIESYPQRIAMYKRIANIHNDDDASDVIDELIDRFGEPSSAVMGLIRVALLKNIAADNGIYEITQRGNAILLFVDAIDKSVLTKLAVLKGRVMANASSKPYYSVRLKNGQSSLAALEEAITALSASKEENGNVPS